MTYGAHLVATEPAPLDLVRRTDFQRLLIGSNARGDLSRLVTANLPAEVLDLCQRRFEGRRCGPTTW
jgi:hypothetical protein